MASAVYLSDSCTCWACVYVYVCIQHKEGQQNMNNVNFELLCRCFTFFYVTPSCSLDCHFDLFLVLFCFAKNLIKLHQNY